MKGTMSAMSVRLVLANFDSAAAAVLW